MSVSTQNEVAKATLNAYGMAIATALQSCQAGWPSTPLFDPIRYLLDLGGKRIRPALVLASCEAEGGNHTAAMPAALAVEIFHNFTLMHDDIMDHAPLRRGKTTVHEKWDVNTAILSGDAMFVEAYQALLGLPPAVLPATLALFNRTATEVCAGQERDMAFERLHNVTVDEYLEMIRLKTSVLLAAALQMGAMIAGADDERSHHYYDLGIALGMAFQLQDDYLDAFGDPEHFGKQVGGDILSDKKTFLYLRCLERANEEQRQRFNELTQVGIHPEEKIEGIKGLFLETGAADELRERIGQFHDRAMALIEQLSPNEKGRAVFEHLAAMVSTRMQ